MGAERLFEKFYYSRPDFVDGTTRFHRMCRKSIAPGSSILEIGAGPDNKTSRFLATIGPVTGLDTSPEVRSNPSLSAAVVYAGDRIPFPDASFEACVANYVLEHLEEPARHLVDAARVLKPGGVYCFRTPNLWHYVTIASLVLPHAAHVALSNRLRGLSQAHEPHVTYYRANSRRTLARLARRANLAVSALELVETEPSYGRRHALLFFPMMAWERLVNRWDALGFLRANLFGVLRKDGG